MQMLKLRASGAAAFVVGIPPLDNLGDGHTADNQPERSDSNGLLMTIQC